MCFCCGWQRTTRFVLSCLHRRGGPSGRFLIVAALHGKGGRRHSEPGGLANRPCVPVLHPYYATRPRRVWEEARRPCVYLLVPTRVVLVSSRACVPMAIGWVDLCLTRCPVAATVRPTWWQHTPPYHDVVALRGVEYKEHRQTKWAQKRIEETCRPIQTPSRRNKGGEAEGGKRGKGGEAQKIRHRRTTRQVVSGC